MIIKYIKSILLVAGITNVIPATSQNKQDYNWVTGSEHVNGYPKPIINFEHDTIKIKEAHLPFAFSRMNSGISDRNGNLLLYFNGCSIANGNHEILENGSEFNKGPTASFECPKNYGYPGSIQTALILPQPGSDSIYYVFYARYDDTPTSTELSLLHAKVDVSYNNNQGIVLFKDVQVSQDSIMTMGRLSAVRHSNDRDWWIIVFGKSETNDFKRILLTSEGIQNLENSEIGVINSLPGGQTSFSPDGTKYMRYSTKGLSIMDFNRNTGLLSNHRFVSLEPEGVYFGGAFSPNGRFVYLSNYTTLYQVDTWNEMLILEEVAEWDGFTHNGFPVRFGTMQIGADCRIYVSSLNGLPFVHVIKNPDEKGVACNFEQHAFEFSLGYLGFPHFPNFRLGTNEPFCDPNKVIITGVVTPDNSKLKEPLIFPNPTSQDFTIRADKAIQLVEIYNTNGTLIHSESPNRTEFNISTQNWTKGVYIIKMKEKDSSSCINKRLVLMQD